MGLNEKWKEKVRIRLLNRLSKMCQQKIAKTALKTYLLLMRSHALQGCKHAYTFLSVPVDNAQKNGKKGEFLSEFRLSFHANDDQRKIAKFDNQTYLWSSKGPETSQQSTRNLALCVISMGWEKKKEKEHFKPQRQQLTCVTPVFIMVIFFASRSMPCCGLLRIAVFAAAFGSMMLLLTAYLVPGIVPAGTVVYVAPGFLDSYLLCI